MTMKKYVYVAGIILVLITVGLSGCTQQESSDESDVQADTPDGESLLMILSKADDIESLYYEITATITMLQIGTQTANIKIWQKLPYVKEQVTTAMGGMTNTMTVIHRPEGNYTYDAALGTYILANDTSSFATSLQYFDADMIKNYLNTQNITDLQTEIIDGKKATVFEYSIAIQPSSPMTIKMWIWNEKGLPLKAYIDMALEQTQMTMDMVFSHYSFDEIPDSTFSVST